MLALGFNWGLSGPPPHPGAPGGTARTANVISRTSAVSTYPPTVDFTRPLDWQDGDSAVMQRSQSETFASGVSEVTQTLAGATTTYDFGLSNIVSGTWYIRMAAYHGARPGSLNWSNTAGIGDAAAPTITSGTTFSGYQFITGSLALTASKTVTWAVIGGANQDQVSISGQSLLWDAQTVAGTLDVQVQAADLFGNVSTVQTITGTIAANTPDAFSFTDITTATRSTLYTSNTITIAGLQGGVSVPVTVTGGTYSKNGGTYTSTSGTAINGDTFALRQTSSASYSTEGDVVLTVGSTSDTYAVTTLDDPAATSANNKATLAYVNNGGATNNYTYTNVVSGTGRLVVALNVQSSSGQQVSGVTYNGVAMSLVTRSTGDYGSSIWELAGVSAGTHDLVVTTSGTFSLRSLAGSVRTLANSPNAGVAATPLAYGYYDDPNNHTGALTLPTGGYGIGTVVSESPAGSVTWAFGTKDGTDQSGSGPLLSSVAHFTASGTPALTGFAYGGAGMSAAYWGP